MQAGRELDAVVAERLGWEKVEPAPGSNMTWVRPDLEYRKRYFNDTSRTLLDMECPKFSTSIAAAWELVEEAKKFHGRQRHIFLGWLVEPITEISPLAICIAFLKATESGRD